MSEISDIIDEVNRGSGTDMPFDRKAYADRMRIRREETYRMADEAATRVAKQQPFYEKYLEIQGRFPELSAGNALLVTLQRPDATEINDADGWKEYGIRISRGEKGFVILEPSGEYIDRDGNRRNSFTVKKVFDISQTNAEKKQIRPSQDMKTLLKTIIMACPVAVMLKKEMPHDLNALYDAQERIISVKSSISADNAFGCIAEEFAHVLLDCHGRTREETDFTARSAAYSLCLQYGENPAAIPLSDFSSEFAGKTPKEIRFELYGIKRVISELERRMELCLNPPEIQEPVKEASVEKSEER